MLILTTCDVDCVHDCARLRQDPGEWPSMCGSRHEIISHAPSDRASRLSGVPGGKWGRCYAQVSWLCAGDPGFCGRLWLSSLVMLNEVIHIRRVICICNDYCLDPECLEVLYVELGFYLRALPYKQIFNLQLRVTHNSNRRNYESPPARKILTDNSLRKGLPYPGREEGCPIRRISVSPSS